MGRYKHKINQWVDHWVLSTLLQNRDSVISIWYQIFSYLIIRVDDDGGGNNSFNHENKKRDRLGVHLLITTRTHPHPVMSKKIFLPLNASYPPFKHFISLFLALPAMLAPPLEHTYPSLDDAQLAVKRFVLDQGYAVGGRTRSKFPKSGKTRKVCLHCSHGLEYRNRREFLTKGNRKRKTSSRCIECPCSLTIKWDLTAEGWMWQVKVGEG